MGIEKLATLSARRPWITILIWVVLIVISGFLIFKFLNSALTTEQDVSHETEAQKAQRVLKDRLGTKEQVSELVIVKSDKYKVTDPTFKQFTTDLQKKIADLDFVDSSASFYETQNPGLVSRNGDATIVIVNLKGSVSEAEGKIAKLSDIVKEADQNDNFQVVHSGEPSVNKGFQEIAEKDLQKAEFVGIPVALVILIFVFGAIGAAFLPIILAFLAIALALAASAIFGQFSSLSFFVTNMITMMGLAVGIDYSLFVVSRFREERAHGSEKFAAITTAGRTASRAVFFSGITVVVALAGLLLVPSNIFRSLSVGAIFVVIAAVIAALTLLPALLSLLGDRINFLTIPFIKNTGYVDPERKGFWQSVASVVMKHPLISVELSAGLLLLAALPVLFINIGSSGVESLPQDLEAKEGFVMLQQEFASGLLSPTQIVVDGEISSQEAKTALSELESQTKNIAAVEAVTIASDSDKNISITTAVLNTTGQDSIEAVKKIRGLEAVKKLKDSGLGVYVGGQDALQEDFTQIIRDYTPIVFTFVLALSFLFLLLVFRSLVVPAKAIIMNLLSVGAAYGLLVLVFQFGVGADLFGFTQTDQIESWIPLFLFAILFGLSMDYHVFLLSRIREKFTQTGDNTKSVIFGLVSTGRLITGAALIMVAVFAGFASGQLVMFQQVGFGLAVAILLDATIIRSILVPASMKLLGKWNWYLPSWLSWLPKIGIEG